MFLKKLSNILRCSLIVLYLFILLTSGCNSDTRIHKIHAATDTLTFPFSFNGVVSLKGNVLTRGKAIDDKKFMVDTCRANFLFDTGAYGLTLDSEFVANNKLAFNYDSLYVPNRRTMRQIKEPVYFQIEKERYSVPDNSLASLKNLFGYQIDAIIGHSIISDKVAVVNFDKHTLKIFSDTNFVAPPGYTKFDLLTENGLYYLFCEIIVGEKTYRPKLMLDFGFPGIVLLNPHIGNNLQQHVRFKKVSYYSKYAGIVGENKGIVTRASKLTLGAFSWNDPPLVCTQMPVVETSVKEGGLLGTTILSRFNIILDLYNKRLYLKPRLNLKDEFMTHRLGFTMVDRSDINKPRLVTSIYVNSAADSSGLKIDDVITHINGKSVLTINNTEWQEINKLEKITLTIKSKNVKEKKIRLFLRDYL